MAVLYYVQDSHYKTHKSKKRVQVRKSVTAVQYCRYKFPMEKRFVERIRFKSGKNNDDRR